MWAYSFNAFRDWAFHYNFKWGLLLLFSNFPDCKMLALALCSALSVWPSALCSRNQNWDIFHNARFPYMDMVCVIFWVLIYPCWVRVGNPTEGVLFLLKTMAWWLQCCLEYYSIMLEKHLVALCWTSSSLNLSRTYSTPDAVRAKLH